MFLFSSLPLEEQWSRLGEEHRRLEEVLEEVATMIAEGRSPREVIQAMLQFLEFYTSLHFRHEEEFFARFLPKEDPDLRQNEEEHRQLKAWLAQFKARLAKLRSAEERRQASLELQQKLRSHLEEHSLRVDRRLAEKCDLPRRLRVRK